MRGSVHFFPYVKGLSERSSNKVSYDQHLRKTWIALYCSKLINAAFTGDDRGERGVLSSGINKRPKMFNYDFI